MSIDFSKFSKYSKAGPRYTSYPTALEFSEEFKYDEYISLLKNSKRSISIYLHIPFCQSACYFCGCNVVYTSKDDKKRRYIDYLKKELLLLENIIDCSKEVVSFHIGGGTPTYLSPLELDEIITDIKNTFTNFSPTSEMACEIDPRSFGLEYMKVLQKHKFNRLSFGVQDFDPKVQEAIHRIQSPKLIEESVKLSRDLGVESINFDLIYGLPYQSLDSFMDTLKIVASLKPNRVAIFNYAHVPWMKKGMRKIDETKLPPPSEKLLILKSSIEFLEESGYKMIGMDHFALESDSLYKALKDSRLKRSFQGYIVDKNSDTLGIGLTSIGEGVEYYSQNYKDLQSYEESLDSSRLPYFRGVRLNSEDLLRKEIILSLLSNLRVDIKMIEERFEIDFKKRFAKELEELEEFVEEGLVEIGDSEIIVSQTGALLIRNIAMPFDEYLKRLDSTQNRFSKTV